MVHPSADLVATVHAMEARQDWFREYLVAMGNDPLNVPAPSVNSVDAARKVRAMLNLPDQWAEQQPSSEAAVRTLKLASERAGIMVVINGIVGNNTHRVLHPEEFRGFVLVDDHAPLIFVNGSDAKPAQLFTMAHELAHIIYRKSAAFDLRDFVPAEDPVERLCNQAAAEFLVPQDKFLDGYRSTEATYDSLQASARHFRVSVMVVLRRALELQVIDQARFWDLVETHRRSMQDRPSRRGDGGGDYYKNQDYRIGRPFFGAVARATQEGSLPLLEGYRLTGLWGRAFERYASLLASEGAL
jgi:Zn-dependent peptidase ImmA (M78 family)